MLDVHAEDLSFVTLWPESEDGYAAWLAPKDEYRRLFRLLSRPGCLELLEHLHCHKRSYFVAQAVAKQLDMPVETVEELLKALEERQILRSVELELEIGEARAYELAEPAAFVPLLYIARCFMQSAFLGVLVEMLPSRTGKPQCGHMIALSLIWPEHSGHWMSAI